VQQLATYKCFKALPQYINRIGMEKLMGYCALFAFIFSLKKALANEKPNIFSHLALKKGNYNYFAMAAQNALN
jgi:hypothetical protein